LRPVRSAQSPAQTADASHEVDSLWTRTGVFSGTNKIPRSARNLAAPARVAHNEGIMQIILFRHGIAMEHADAAADGISEKERPLTKEGVEKTATAASGLRQVVKSVELLAHSPLTRARQTADLLADAFPSAERAETRWLAPGVDPERLAAWLAKQREMETAILVGHEPDLSRWAAWAVSGSARPLFGLKKAGARSNSKAASWLEKAGCSGC
jgi:phosphohistidine phosphatase